MEGSGRVRQFLSPGQAGAHHLRVETLTGHTVEVSKLTEAGGAFEGASNSCTVCHKADKHKFKRGH